MNFAGESRSHAQFAPGLIKAHGWGSSLPNIKIVHSLSTDYLLKKNTICSKNKLFLSIELQRDEYIFICRDVNCKQTIRGQQPLLIQSYNQSLRHPAVGSTGIHTDSAIISLLVGSLCTNGGEFYHYLFSIFKWCVKHKYMGYFTKEEIRSSSFISVIFLILILGPDSSIHIRHCHYDSLK